MPVLSALRQRMDRYIAARNPVSSGQILLHNRRLYILPTRFGYLYAIMQIVLLLAAINYQNSMAYVLTFLLTALGIISLWQTHKNLLGISVQLNTPKPVFQGEDLILQFTLIHENPIQRYAIGIQYLNAAPEYTRLQPDQASTISLALPAIRRGLFRPAGVVIFTRYPTGLFHAWSWLKFDVPILIYPKPLYDIKLRESLADPEHSKSTVNTTDGDDFAGLREHRQGESLRHISWKAYAQGRGMLTKTFQGHASPSLWINWSDMTATAQEARLAQMTALVIQANQLSQNYGVNLPGQEIAQHSGSAHFANCLKQISCYNQTAADAELAIE